MFNFSTKTEINKSFKMSELNKQIHATKDCKKEEQSIESVILKNIISPKTINVDADSEIKEIYVFEIRMKERFIPMIFIKEMDASIKLATLFLIKHEDYECGCMAYKKERYKDKYLSTIWGNRLEYDIPLGSSVSQTYKFILSKFLKYDFFEYETVNQYVKRVNSIIKYDFQIKNIENAAYHDSQSKRKFEYNAKLKEYKMVREKLLKGE